LRGVNLGEIYEGNGRRIGGAMLTLRWRFYGTVEAQIDDLKYRGLARRW
jgi:hypothetical protein